MLTCSRRIQGRSAVTSGYLQETNCGCFTLPTSTRSCQAPWVPKSIFIGSSAHGCGENCGSTVDEEKTSSGYGVSPSLWVCPAHSKNEISFIHSSQVREAKPWVDGRRLQAERCEQADVIRKAHARRLLPAIHQTPRPQPLRDGRGERQGLHLDARCGRAFAPYASFTAEHK